MSEVQDCKRIAMSCTHGLESTTDMAYSAHHGTDQLWRHREMAIQGLVCICPYIPALQLTQAVALLHDVEQALLEFVVLVLLLPHAFFTAMALALRAASNCDCSVTGLLCASRHRIAHSR